MPLHEGEAKLEERLKTEVGIRLADITQFLKLNTVVKGKAPHHGPDVIPWKKCEP